LFGGHRKTSSFTDGGDDAAGIVASWYARTRGTRPAGETGGARVRAYRNSAWQ